VRPRISSQQLTESRSHESVCTRCCFHQMLIQSGCSGLCFFAEARRDCSTLIRVALAQPLRERLHENVERPVAEIGFEIKSIRRPRSFRKKTQDSPDIEAPRRALSPVHLHLVGPVCPRREHNAISPSRLYEIRCSRYFHTPILLREVVLPVLLSKLTRFRIQPALAFGARSPMV
jgi:hypothetical protein